MPASFRSPLVLLGIPAIQPETQAGAVSLLAPWLFRGGAAPQAVVIGFTGLMCPWLGGASAVPGQVIPPNPQTGGGGGLYFIHDRQKPKRALPGNDDAEVLDFIAMWVAFQSNTDDL